MSLSAQNMLSRDATLVNFPQVRSWNTLWIGSQTELVTWLRWKCTTRTSCHVKIKHFSHSFQEVQQQRVFGYRMSGICKTNWFAGGAGRATTLLWGEQQQSWTPPLNLWVNKFMYWGKYQAVIRLTFKKQTSEEKCNIPFLQNTNVCSPIYNWLWLAKLFLPIHSQLSN